MISSVVNLLNEYLLSFSLVTPEETNIFQLITKEHHIKNTYEISKIYLNSCIPDLLEENSQHSQCAPLFLHSIHRKVVHMANSSTTNAVEILILRFQPLKVEFFSKINRKITAELYNITKSLCTLLSILAISNVTSI